MYTILLDSKERYVNKNIVKVVNSIFLEVSVEAVLTLLYRQCVVGSHETYNVCTMVRMHA